MTILIVMGNCPYNNVLHFSGGYQRQIVAILFLSVSLNAKVKDA